MDIAMKCKAVMEQNRLETEELERKIREVSKYTINFLIKHDIPLTPINYNEWFYVVCRSLEEKHVISDKNLKVLYGKYIEEIRRQDFDEKKDIRQISQELEKITNNSEKILDSFDMRVNRHSEIINENMKVIQERDLQRLSLLQEKIRELEMENKELKKYIEFNKSKLERIKAKFIKTQAEVNYDALTNVFSRKKLDQDLQLLDNNLKKFSVVFLDIDNFKKINDSFGHAVGDKILKETGNILRRYLRRNTYAYRYGGEEFVVILPEGNLEAAKVVAERLRNIISNTEVKINENQTIRFTASFGAAQKEEGEAAINVLKRADEALYEAKRSGKNRVVTR